MFRILAAVLVSCGLLAATQTNLVVAQVVVQQPVFRQFQTTGSMMVPDGGAMYQSGSVGSGFFSRQAGVMPFRPFSNRISGGQWSTGGVIVTAQIINFQEMEEQLLTQLSPKYLAQLAEQEAKLQQAEAEKLALHQGKVREAQQQIADQRLEKAKEDVRWARRFAKDGNIPAAESYYQRAIKALPSDLAELAEQELRKLRDHK